MQVTTFLPLIFFSASILVLVATSVCYVTRWDEVAAITLYPYWFWAVCGLLVCATSHALKKSKASKFVAAAWILAGLIFADELLPIFRGMLPLKVPPGTFRVVSLNCAGTPAAIREILPVRPDIVLLQEVPGTNYVAEVSQQLFGTNGCYVSGFDCAIIARCPVVPVATRDTYHIGAIVKLHQEKPVLVTSLRLVPPETRSDLWNPTAWQEYTSNRRERARQLGDTMLSVPDRSLPHIIGGDFNAPGGESIYRLMTGYSDAYATAGRGWGHTALNNIPIVRPDQIWMSGLRAYSARAMKTMHSDHRMVIAEIGLR